MLEVQKYLLDHTLEQLSEELGIKVKKYSEDNIVLLDYDQIESPKTHPIVIECRSLILSLDDYSVVSSIVSSIMGKLLICTKTSALKAQQRTRRLMVA